MNVECKGLWELSDKELIEQFESDLFDYPGGYNMNFQDSTARKELMRRGKSALRPIIDHLRSGSSDKKDQVIFLWMLLLSWMEPVVDPDRSGPENIRDEEGWLAWAENFAKK